MRQRQFLFKVEQGPQSLVYILLLLTLQLLLNLKKSLQKKSLYRHQLRGYNIEHVFIPCSNEHYFK